MGTSVFEEIAERNVAKVEERVRGALRFPIDVPEGAWDAWVFVEAINAAVALIAKELGGLAPLGTAPQLKDDRWQRPAVAVIYADGDIIDGKSRTIPLVGRKLVGGETLAAQLAAARAHPDVKAIVLRIDSPVGVSDSRLACSS